MPRNYCRDGAMTTCPAGRYGPTEGLDSAGACSNCGAGHFCPEQSISMVRRRLLSAAVTLVATSHTHAWALLWVVSDAMSLWEVPYAYWRRE